MGGFLSGILGAAGEDVLRERKQRYAEDLSRHQMRLQMLSDAAQHAQTPEQRAEAFRQMDEINDEPIGGGGRKRGGKAGQPGKFSQMGQLLQVLAGGGGGGLPGQNAQTPPFLPSGVFKNVGPAVDAEGGGTSPAPTVAPTSSAPPMTTPFPVNAAPMPATQPTPNVQIPEMPPSRLPQSRYNPIFGTQEQAEGLEERGARRKMAREIDELRAKGVVGLEMSDSEMKQKLKHIDVVSGYLTSKGMDEKAARDEATRIVFPQRYATAGQKFAPFYIGGDKIPSDIQTDALGNPIDRTGDTRYKLDEISKQYYPAVATPVQERLYGAIQGYYHYWRGRGLSDEAAKAKAGEDFRNVQGKHLGRLEQQAAIDTALSNIGLGQGLQSGGPGAPMVPTQPVTAPAGHAPASSAPAGGSRTPPLPPRRTAGPGGSPLTQGGMTPRENDDVLAYLSSLTGTQKGASKAAQVRQQNGLRTIARVTGLDPMTLTARLSETPALAKQIGETIQRAGAIQRLNNTLEKHGQMLVEAAQNITQTNSPLLNKPVREWRRRISGSPELKRFEVARNEVMREYAYLTAGGAQSRAMLPVGVEDKMNKLFSDDVTAGEVAALVDQIRTSAQREKAAMDKTVTDLQRQMLMGPAGQATGAKPTAIGGENRPKVRIISVQ